MNSILKSAEELSNKTKLTKEGDKDQEERKKNRKVNEEQYQDQMATQEQNVHQERNVTQYIQFVSKKNKANVMNVNVAN